MDEEGPEQGTLFEIEVDEDDGCVWVVSSEGRGSWCQNLGPKQAVREKWATWLGAEFED